MREELREVRLEKNVLIPMEDGVTLAADLFAPASGGPFPALVSYYPYHKDDLIGSMLDFSCRYFAERGYAQLLVDFRGLGGSEGVAWEMLDPEEGRDGAEIVQWAARQPWCDGNVGMWGISYGGITSLQTASLRPPALRAIAPVYACLDVYHDFLYPGGSRNCLGAYGSWGSFMLAMNLLPPAYQDPEGRWYRVWTERLAGNQPFVLPWTDHPDHDPYWHGRRIAADRITVPTFAIGGWRDLFPEAMVRLYEELAGPKKLLVGPWTHTPPDLSPVEPVDYLKEMTRWWDRWLKGEENGIGDEAPVTLFVQGLARWRNESEWPLQRVTEHTLFLAPGRSLAESPPGEEGSDPYQTLATVGTRAGLWEPTPSGLGAPLDQGPDDLRSLTYTTLPLDEDLEVTGSPEATLNVAPATGDPFCLVAKLCDVRPDGSSVLITTGWLNAAHHRSHSRPEPLEPGRVYELRVSLWATSYLVKEGHRLRLSLSGSDFPRLWPGCTSPRITAHFGGSRPSSLRLPAVPPAAAPLPEPSLPRPDPWLNRFPWHREAVPTWKVEHDHVAGSVTVTTGLSQHLCLPTGGSVRMETTARASVAPARPEGACAEGEARVRLELPAGPVEVETQSWFSGRGMVLTGRVTVNGRVFFEKTWRK